MILEFISVKIYKLKFSIS